MFDFIRGGKSLIKSANNSGDKMEPCGTDDCGLIGDDFSPPIHTICVLSDKYELSKFIMHGSRGKRDSFFNRISWLIRSNAFAKSINIASI